jgi:hypothetical protein
MAPLEYSEARGTLIHKNNLKLKISCQTPFNTRLQVWSQRTGSFFHKEGKAQRKFDIVIKHLNTDTFVTLRGNFKLTP